MTTKNEILDEAMEKIQEFASMWSLSGGRYDDGSYIERGKKLKKHIREFLAEHLRPVKMFETLPDWGSMKPSALVGPEPELLAELLQKRGWILSEQARLDGLYALSKNGRQLTFPADVSAPDYLESVALAFKKLAEIEVTVKNQSKREPLSEEQYYDIAEKFANRDWNSDQPDGYLNAIKDVCNAAIEAEINGGGE